MFGKGFLFFTMWAFASVTFFAMERGRILSILAGCLVGYLAILLFNYLQGEYSNKEQEREPGEYKYCFQQHPFDDFHPFSVQAANRTEADRKAQEIFATLVAENKTIMRKFYPAA